MPVKPEDLLKKTTKETENAINEACQYIDDHLEKHFHGQDSIVVSISKNGCKIPSKLYLEKICKLYNNIGWETSCKASSDCRNDEILSITFNYTKRMMREACG